MFADAGRGATKSCLLLTVILSLGGCAGSARLRSGAAPESLPSDVFFQRIASLCGQSFAGRIVADTPVPAAPDPFVGKALVMHVRECSGGELRIPFHVGDDRSRTWVITRQAG